MDLMRLRAEEKGLNLSEQEIPESCQFVRSDGEKLGQVLVNLVSNAVKHTERGSVVLRVSDQPAWDAQHCRLVIEVQDTGIGIASVDQARIFEPFVQAAKLSTSKGTGLGLAITKKYVELMGGSIQVDSEPGKGSLFRVEIPVMKVDRSEVPAASLTRSGRITGLAPGQPEYRVLIVEDREENWLLLHRLLQNAGFQVRVAEDGATGIEQFLAWRPHFIWMDWRLPTMDGLEATRRIRELDGGGDVKIAILSAFAFTEYRDEALAVVDDFVGKPFRAEEIFDCLARHLGVRYAYHTAVSEKAPSTLEQEALEALPVELRKELMDAVISLDIERIDGVISCISGQDAALGRTLAQYTGRFAYSSILQALQSSETVRT
jgi:CheY-like chemotaxis protein/anti-sigma regulatory factor (Ser/Thr protein kinase)